MKKVEIIPPTHILRSETRAIEDKMIIRYGTKPRLGTAFVLSVLLRVPLVRLWKIARLTDRSEWLDAYGDSMRKINSANSFESTQSAIPKPL